MTKAKILIVCHNKQKAIKNDIIETIQVGRALSGEEFEGMIGDDTGGNISKENRRYNELTAQYWAFKNYEALDNPDYIGFMHYRRHFVFDKTLNYKDNKTWFLNISLYLIPEFNEKYLNNLSVENITETLEDGADCYAIKPYDINFMHNNDLYIKEHYISTIAGSKRYVWNIFYETLHNLYPDYAGIIDEIAYGHFINPCNMFIMKKELFMKYAEFCFNVLGEVDKKVNSDSFNVQEKRFLGYLGEYLLTIFILKLKKENCKIKYLDGLMFQDMKTGKPEDKLSFLESIFSLKNSIDKRHKIVTILGTKFKLKNHPSEMSQLRRQIQNQERMTKMLLEKVTELQEEIILKGKK